MRPTMLCAVLGVVAACLVHDAPGMVSCERKTLIHSHNDYAQKRPFWGAYEAGADSIEADIYLVDGDLLVAHDRNKAKASATLRSMYLEPIRSVVGKHGGRARADGRPLQLVVDLNEELVKQRDDF